jgi:hypothetical protein
MQLSDWVTIVPWVVICPMLSPIEFETRQPTTVA